MRIFSINLDYMIHFISLSIILFFSWHSNVALGQTLPKTAAAMAAVLTAGSKTDEFYNNQISFLFHLREKHSLSRSFVLNLFVTLTIHDLVCSFLGLKLDLIISLCPSLNRNKIHRDALNSNENLIFEMLNTCF